MSELQRLLSCINFRASFRRKLGGSAICAKYEQNSTAALSVAYLFFIIYGKTSVGQLQIEIYSKLSANSSIVLTFSSFIVDLIVTTGSTISIFLNPSTIPFIIFAAIGAQDPFSMNATLRF